MQAVKYTEINEILNSRQILYTTVVPYFLWVWGPYEQRVVITMDQNGQFYWRWPNSFYSSLVEIKKHSPFFYINGQVLYIKPDFKAT